MRPFPQTNLIIFKQNNSITLKMYFIYAKFRAIGTSGGGSVAEKIIGFCMFPFFEKNANGGGSDLLTVFTVIDCDTGDGFVETSSTRVKFISSSAIAT